MKLKIMIMALLMVSVGIGSAINWIPESSMEPSADLTFDGGDIVNVKNVDLDTMTGGTKTPTMGQKWIYNDVSDEYSQEIAPPAAGVIVGELDEAIPKSWEYDYKYSTNATLNILPGIYDTAMEALDAVISDLENNYSCSHIYIAPGVHTVASDWTLTNKWGSGNKLLHVTGIGDAELAFSTGGIVLNSSTYAGITIDDLHVSGSGYADGYSGVRVSDDSAMYPYPLIIENCLFSSFETAINLSSETVTGPYSGRIVNNYIDSCTNGIVLGGGACLVSGNVVRDDKGANTIGIYLKRSTGSGSSAGGNTLVGNSGGKCDIGLKITSSYNTVVGQYQDSTSPAGSRAILITGESGVPPATYTTVYSARCNRIPIEVNGTELYRPVTDTTLLCGGTSTYPGFTDQFIIGSWVDGVYLQASGKYGALDVTVDSAADNVFYTPMYTAEAPTGALQTNFIGAMIFDPTPTSGQPAFWGYDGETWQSVSYA